MVLPVNHNRAAGVPVASLDYRHEGFLMRSIKFNRRGALTVIATGLTGAAVAFGAAPAAPAPVGTDSARDALGSYGKDGPPQPFDADIKNNTMAVSPDERVAVVANSESGKVRVIDLNGVHRTRELGGYVTPRNILFAPDGTSFYLSDSSRGVVDQIALRSARLSSRMPLGAGAFGTAMTNDGNRLYVNNQASNTVTVIDLSLRQPVTVIGGFAQPRQGIKLSPANDMLYVTNFQGDRVTKVDPATNEVIAQFQGFNQIRGLSISGDGSRLYGANSGDNTISIVDTASGTTVGRVPVGDKPYGAALSPDESVLLSGDLGSHTLTVVDPTTGGVKGAITGTKGPRQAIAFAKSSIKAWVLNEDLTVAEVDVPGMKVTRTLG